MTQKLIDALNLLNGIHCAGRDDITRMLAAMQKIEDVARELQNPATKKESGKNE